MQKIIHDIPGGPTTRNDFLDGRLTLHQPEKGFRAGTDSVLLGASVSPHTKTLLDLGSGVGAAGLTAMVHNQDLHSHFVDNSQAALALCAQNISQNNFTTRAKTLRHDITTNGTARQQAGLKQDFYDCVIANPPYYDQGTISPLDDAYKDAAFATPVGALDHWVKTATACARQGGEIIFIHRAQGLPDLLAAFQSRIGTIEVLPLAPFTGAPATRILVRGIRGARGPLTLLAPRVLHSEKGGPFCREIDDIMRGRAILHWK